MTVTYTNIATFDTGCAKIVEEYLPCCNLITTHTKSKRKIFVVFFGVDTDAGLILPCLCLCREKQGKNY